MYVISRIFLKLAKLIFGKESINKYYHNKAVKKLHKEGHKALSAANDVGKDFSAHFDLSFGSLLGAYRDHGFIPYDDDLDFTLDINHLSNDLINSLLAHGFTIEEVFVASDYKGCQIPMKFNGLTCDIYFTYLGADNNYHTYVPHPIKGMDWGLSAKYNIYKSRDISIPFYNKRELCKFSNYEVLIPSNSFEILSHIYGQDFMTPKKGVITEVEADPLCEKFFNIYPLDIFIEEGILSAIENTR